MIRNTARAGSPCGQVFGIVVYVCCRFFRRGFLGGEPPRAFGWRGYAAYRFFCRGFLGGEPPQAFGWRGREPLQASIRSYSCALVLVSIVWVFSTNARNDNVFVWFYSGNCYNSVTRARNDKVVRNLLSLPPRGKVDCRSIAKARRMRGKRRYVFIRFYSPHSPLGSLCYHSCHLPPRGKALKR